MGESPIEQMRTPAALRFQRRAVTVERVGWGLMALFIVAALAGLFGPGPLSTSRASSDDGRLVVDYPRFLRSGSTTAIEVHLTVEEPSVEPRLTFGTDFLSTYTIEDVQPDPGQVIAHGDRIEFVFAPPQDASGISLRFHLRADSFGPRSAAIDSTDATVNVRQFIYP